MGIVCCVVPACGGGKGTKTGHSKSCNSKSKSKTCN